MSAAPTLPEKAEIDFFSYTGKDQSWADWIAWQLAETSHKTLIQGWDFKSGSVFSGDIHYAHVMAVLTPDYMASGFGQPKWQVASADDSTGEKSIHACVRVSDFKSDGILRGRTFLGLVGQDAATATSFVS